MKIFAKWITNLFICKCLTLFPHLAFIWKKGVISKEKMHCFEKYGKQTLSSTLAASTAFREDNNSICKWKAQGWIMQQRSSSSLPTDQKKWQIKKLGNFKKHQSFIKYKTQRFTLNHTKYVHSLMPNTPEVKNLYPSPAQSLRTKWPWPAGYLSRSQLPY